MITLCVIPNFTGTIKEYIGCAILCIMLDSTYILPMILS